MRYGGNTPCVSLTLDSGHSLVLDAGTGLHVLGRHAEQAGLAEHTWLMLLSHPHWDHIQGLPMFAPLMNPSNRFHVLCEMKPEWFDVLLSQFDGVRFPFERSDIAAEVSPLAAPGDAEAALAPFGLTPSWIPMDHPGECFGYRLSSADAEIVYMTDNELAGTDNPRFDDFVGFCRGADVLIHDAHLVRSDGDDREGWGHSFVEDAVQLAHRAGARELLLFHHDPLRTDDEIDELQDLARELLSGLGSTTRCRAAFEGLTIDFRGA